ncbi:MAG: acyl carrier domain protein [Candidatus Xenolissoclinum pacificiensis L6]|uniref:Acyl carrier protein n=1 Tax=Candidatus Xenolissoclinum pacificiensis L6 TaxID=1401685 RepID=W2UZX3_9RICK|nr:MAG: acyl carrier domain protein [Candidatus Xenolissoclinum pacificiensis L6]
MADLIVENKDTSKIIDALIAFKIKQIMIKTSSAHAEADVLAIKMDEDFSEKLDLDSLDTVELVMQIEECFSVEIPDEEAEKMITMSGICKYVREKLDDKGENLLEVITEPISEILPYLEGHFEITLTDKEKATDGIATLVSVLADRLS